MSHVPTAAAWATGASAAYMLKANATARLRAELLRKKIERTKAHFRVPVSNVVIPAYMRLMVAME
jgi:hypothetical protein